MQLCDWTAYVASRPMAQATNCSMLILMCQQLVETDNPLSRGMHAIFFLLFVVVCTCLC